MPRARRASVSVLVTLACLVAVSAVAPPSLRPYERVADVAWPVSTLVVSEVQTGGERMGAVGGRIVAEVMLGLLQGDRQSYLNQDPDWVPTYGQGGEFAVKDLLEAAEVVAELV